VWKLSRMVVTLLLVLALTLAPTTLAAGYSASEADVSLWTRISSSVLDLLKVFAPRAERENQSLENTSSRDSNSQVNQRDVCEGSPIDPQYSGGPDPCG